MSSTRADRGYWEWTGPLFHHRDRREPSGHAAGHRGQPRSLVLAPSLRDWALASSVAAGSAALI